MEQAAQVDGATAWQAFRKVIVPLAAPGVFTAAILTFFFCWNEFLLAISLTSTDRARTVPAALSFFTGASQFEPPVTAIMAASVVVTDPGRHHRPAVPAPDRRRAHLRRREGLTPIRPQGASMAEITLKNIVKKYGDGFPAVNDVSLDIADGEFMILVGPSGCGKSTLLRMIVGLEDITSGDMLIGDKRVNDKAPRDRNLAMVFQNYALYPHLTVYENIAFPLRLAKSLSNDEIEEKVETAAETLELTEHLDRKPGNLSGGQRQRVAMGRAIVRDADAFLFDEPLSNLDAKLRGQMRTEIPRLQRRLGITTVYVTHDQTEAMTLGDRVAVLRRGMLQQVATPRELYEQPGQPVRRRLHRLAADELRARPDGGRHGEAAVRRRSTCPHELREAVGDREWVDGRHPPRALRGRRPARAGQAPRRGRRSTAKIDVVEWLGNEQYAYIPYEPARGRGARACEELEDDLDGEALQPQLVVALDPASRIADGSTAKIWFDPTPAPRLRHRPPART